MNRDKCSTRTLGARVEVNDASRTASPQPMAPKPDARPRLRSGARVGRGSLSWSALALVAACGEGSIEPLPASPSPARALRFGDAAATIAPVVADDAPADPADAGSAGADAGCGDLRTDAANCGSCGHACAPGQVCSAGVCGCAGEPVSFATEIAPLLEARCAGACHAGARPRAGLDLSAELAYDALIDVPAAQCSDGRMLVEPGAAGASYLVHKLLGTSLCAGSQMPRAEALPAAEIALVERWICHGAAR